MLLVDSRQYYVAPPGNQLQEPLAIFAWRSAGAATELECLEDNRSPNLISGQRNPMGEAKVGMQFAKLPKGAPGGYRYEQEF